METFGDPLYSKVHALAVGLLEGTLAPEERHELETMLLENQAARQAYLDYVQESACLRWLCVKEFPNMVELSSNRRDRSHAASPRRRIPAVLFGGGLAGVLAAFAAIWQFSGNESGANVQP